MSANRLFVPLASDPFRWFASGQKIWELRRLGRQYTPKNLMPGRRVELRCGYVDKDSALWGTLMETMAASNVAHFFDLVDFRKVIPTAMDRSAAIQTAAKILGDDQALVIGFRVAVDPVDDILLHADFLPLLRSGKKRSTVRRGLRHYRSNLADMCVAQNGSES